MKRIFLLLLMALPLSAMAQKIGYLSYKATMEHMPEYAQVKEGLKNLREQYEQEAKRTENEFQVKFTEFLQGQKNFPQNILVKRQAELQTLMESGIKFRQEAQELLAKAEVEMMAAVHQKLEEAIRAVGAHGYICIVNTDGNTCPYLSSEWTEDVTLAVLKQLDPEQETEEAQASEEEQAKPEEAQEQTPEEH